jgi:hypothetical protein
VQELYYFFNNSSVFHVVYSDIYRFLFVREARKSLRMLKIIKKAENKNENIDFDEEMSRVDHNILSLF